MAGVDKDTGMPIIGEDGYRIAEKFKAVPDSKKIEESLKVMDDTAKAESGDAEKTLQERYEEGVRNHGMSLAEARQIKESVLTQGFYEATHRIGSMLLKLRTRQYKDTLRVRRAMEAEQLEFPININDLVLQYNAAASLAQYGDRVFVIPSHATSSHADIEAAFKERYEFLGNLPQVVNASIQKKVLDFDNKLIMVFAEGAPEDF
jgi:hypothetical protein